MSSKQQLGAFLRASSAWTPTPHAHVLTLTGLRPAVVAPADLATLLTPLVDAWPRLAAAVDRPPLTRFSRRRPELESWWECRSVQEFRTTTATTEDTP